MFVFAMYDQLTGKQHQFTAPDTVLAKDSLLDYLTQQEKEFEVNDQDYWKDVLTSISGATDVPDMISRASESNLIVSVLHLETK